MPGAAFILRTLADSWNGETEKGRRQQLREGKL